ncbi:MAG: hypothetical protein HKP13_03530, partial [Gammaproteobacteria bacterium]|nr:hypothetical protein [Gammaproteobacteria bacterium]
MTPKQKGPPGTSGKAFQKVNLRPVFYPTDHPIGNNLERAWPEFRDAIRSHGLEPPYPMVPGKRYRFPGIGKGPSNRAGWCRLFPDGLGGCFGDWSTGLSETWQARRDAQLSRAERQIAETRRQTEANRRKAWEHAARRAEEIWRSSNPSDPDHPYLVRKGISPAPETPVRQRRRALVLPVRDFSGRLTSLQFITPDGTKRLLSGGRKQGCFIYIH